MLSLEEAKIIAVQKLSEIEKLSNIKIALLKEKTKSFDYGWVFFYQSEEYVSTGNLQALIGGNAPIIVDKYSGEVHVTGTGNNIEYYIKEYINKRASS